MIKGLPRNADKLPDAPESPCICASRRKPPTSTSPTVFAKAREVVCAIQSNNKEKMVFMPERIPAAGQVRVPSSATGIACPRAGMAFMMKKDEHQAQDEHRSGENEKVFQPAHWAPFSPRQGCRKANGAPCRQSNRRPVQVGMNRVGSSWDRQPRICYILSDA